MVAPSQVSTVSNLIITHLDSTPASNISPAGQDVIAGLSHRQKTLPPRYFYDERGSQLFEEICNTPEYYPTRTESSILCQYADDLAQYTGICELVELGSGSSTKTRHILNAYDQLEAPFYYVPIDVSQEILVASAQQLLHDYPRLQVQGLVGTYEQAIAHLPESPVGARLVIFLGSTLGNFSAADCDRFFVELDNALNPGDYVLLGVDLQKPKAILEAAYNDAAGITAAFNLNMLAHLNWRFGGDFDLDQFTHRAVYNEAAGQVEMYLDSQRSQTIHLRDLDFSFDLAAGESLHTEISRKFNLDTLQTDLQRHHLTPRQIWTDDQQWFGLVLCQR